MFLRFLLSLPLLAILSSGADAQWQYTSPDEIDPLAGDVLEFLDTPRAGFVMNGMSLELAGEDEQAAAFFIAALQMDSNDFGLLLRLAGCYGRLGEASLAAEALRLSQAAGLRRVDVHLRDPSFDNVRETYVFALSAEVLLSREQRYREQMGELLDVPMQSMGRVRYFLPDDFDPARSYPLVLMLHGATGTPENVAAWRQQMPHGEFILAAPAAAYPVFTDHHDSRIWWPGGLSDEQRVLYLEQSAEYVSATVAALQRQFDISLVTIAGFSQGGMLASYCALTRPAEFDALACFSSSLQVSDDLPRRELDFPVFSGLGLQDTAVPPEHSEQLADFLEEQGCPVTRFSSDGGHEISIQELEAFCSWLDALVADARNLPSA